MKPDNILRFIDTGNKVREIGFLLKFCTKMTILLALFQIIYKLSDLGFAKDVSKTQNQCSTFVGTPQYLAPEIYMGKS